MPEVTAYRHGTPSWSDLATTDQDGARAFYSTLFGWEYDDNPMGEGVVYSMAQLKGRAVGAIYTQSPEMGGPDMPPMWNTYVTVDDVDAVAESVSASGGNLVMEPFDVFDSGRMCTVQDPAGAYVSLWQPKAHIGAGLVNEPGAMVWNECMSQNADAAQAFYSKLLGWDIAPSDMGGPDYRIASVGGEMVAGIMPMPPEAGDMPSYWSVYWAVDDTDATIEVALGAGANVVVPATDIPPGRFAFLADPAGAVFGIIKMSEIA